MGFSESNAHVRCEIFRDRDGAVGGWEATIALDMTGLYEYLTTDGAIDQEEFLS